MSDDSGDCHLWRLPTEVRFRIYDFAYGDGSVVTPCSDWEGTIIGSIIDIFVERHMGPHRASTIAERRLVSKQFLAETMQHLAEHKKVRATSCGRGRIANLAFSFTKHICHLTLEWNDESTTLNISKTCPSLRQLWLVVSSRQFSLFDDPERPDETGLRELPLVKALSAIRGLGEFAMQDRAGDADSYECGGRLPRMIFLVTRAERMIRFERLETLLRSIVTGPAAEAEKEDEGDRGRG